MVAFRDDRRFEALMYLVFCKFGSLNSVVILTEENLKAGSGSKIYIMNKNNNSYDHLVTRDGTYLREIIWDEIGQDGLVMRVMEMG